jgi:adenosine deaminase
MTQEIELALQGLELGTQSLRDLIIYGFKRSFYPGDYREKRAYVRQVVNYYDKLMREVEPAFEPPPGR